jgi:hypothetical protein
MNERLFKLLSLLAICILVIVLGFLRYMQSEGMTAAILTIIYSVIDVFRDGEKHASQDAGKE